MVLGALFFNNMSNVFLTVLPRNFSKSVHGMHPWLHPYRSLFQFEWDHEKFHVEVIMAMKYLLNKIISV